jgi:hypothetical protein
MVLGTSRRDFVFTRRRAQFGITDEGILRTLILIVAVRRAVDSWLAKLAHLQHAVAAHGRAISVVVGVTGCGTATIIILTGADEAVRALSCALRRASDHGIQSARILVVATDGTARAIA